MIEEESHQSSDGGARSACIVVRKSLKRLRFYDTLDRFTDYPVAVGRHGGHKHVEGDLKTPEGAYHVTKKLTHSNYFLSFALNYPNNQDAMRGLEEGLITDDVCQQIFDCNAQMIPPPSRTRLGGNICIHGELEKQNWTHGCVRMNNPAIAEIFDRVVVGMPVWIFP